MNNTTTDLAQRIAELPQAKLFVSTEFGKPMTPVYTVVEVHDVVMEAAATLLERIKELEADLKERTAALNITAALQKRAQRKAEELEKQNAEFRRALELIAQTNAMDYEYRQWASAALASSQGQQKGGV